MKKIIVFLGSPDEWLAENVAHLLILCGDIITSKMLISKAINGRMVELSSVTTSFCVVRRTLISCSLQDEILVGFLFTFAADGVQSERSQYPI